MRDHEVIEDRLSLTIFGKHGKYLNLELTLVSCQKNKSQLFSAVVNNSSCMHSRHSSDSGEVGFTLWRFGEMASWNEIHSKMCEGINTLSAILGYDSDYCNLPLLKNEQKFKENLLYNSFLLSKPFF